MRWFRRSVAVSALALCGVSSVASAQAGAALDVRRPKPVVMLLVDTSGSMERMPGQSPSKPFPVCTGDTTKDSLQKNRWAVTLEALTGTFQSFTCRTETRTEAQYKKLYDYNYFIPHFNFTTDAGSLVPQENRQVTDGVIDAFSQRIKFGLMTFDGVGTTLGGDTLVPFNLFKDDLPFKTAVAGAPGIYSYGDVGRLSFPNCTNVYGINSGARGPDAPDGALIPVANDGSGIVDVNDDVQRSLLSVRPFGGTPIAGMLADLKYYLENHPSVKAGGDDKFAECRDRFAILITDGAPDSLFRDNRFQCQSTDDAKCAGGKCSCPYPTEVEIAADLRTSKLLKDLLVVAFDVDDATQDILNEIAQKGGKRDAIPAGTPAELRQQLSAILGAVSQDAATRSVPQIVDNGLPPYAGGQQYEITAGFRIGADEDDPWDGLLYRRRFGCSDASSGGAPQPIPQDLKAADGDLFHLRLDQQAAEHDRTLRTVVPVPAGAVRGVIAPITGLSTRYRTKDDPRLDNTYNVKARSGEFSKTRPNPDSSINPAQGVYATSYTAQPFDTKLAPTLFGDANGDKVQGGADDLAQIVKYAMGDPSVRTTAMADIYHSNPVVLPPLTSDSRYINTADAQLNTFLRTLSRRTEYGTAGRPGVVFVGTNDGVLHAFNLDNWKGEGGTERGDGYEFWGFVPPALFDKMASAAAPTHQEMFDGTPQIRNMLLSRDNKGQGSYRTVLVSALRGAPAYVALDITVADEPPVFLWQFSAPAVGSTVATPALAQARILWDGSKPSERAIAILPGGQGKASSDPSCKSTKLVADKTLADFPSVKRDEVRCWQQLGRSLYVVDVATGQLIQEFDHQHFPSPLTGSVAVDGEGLDLSKAAYFTDQDGVLWRLSMFDPDPSKWLVEPLWDLFHSDSTSVKGFRKGRPSIHPPLLSRDALGNNVIVVGTGDVDNLVDERDADDPFQQRLVSLTETRTVANGVFSGQVTANWDKKLEPGESVTGPLSLFNSVLYFGTFVSPEASNQCLMGVSRLWAVHYVDHKDGVVGEPKPMFPDGFDQGKPLYKSFLQEGFEDSLILGVSVANDPVCVSKTVTSAFSPFKSNQVTAADAQIGGGQFQVRAMISGKGGTRPPGSALNQYSQGIAVPSAARVMGWGGSLE